MTTTKTIVREHEADLVVREVQVAADGVVALTLAAPDGTGLPHWTPGAHIDLILNDTITRQYSLCSNPADPDRWRVGVLRAAESRGGSELVHGLAEGAEIRIRGPRNHFPLVASPRYLFIAGGIGITPILPMIAEAEAAGADWRLLYGGRERATMAFLDELAPYGDRVTWRRRTNPARSISPRRWAGRSRTPWSTAADRRDCWPPSRSSAPTGRRARCISSASPPSRSSPTAWRSRASNWSWSGPV